MDVNHDASNNAFTFHTASNEVSNDYQNNAANTTSAESKSREVHLMGFTKPCFYVVVIVYS